jgi:predicted NBD/HSP70 family sugar kinase
VAWGAGIGAGLVVGGRLHHGHQWFAGEIGHLHLDYREWNRDFGHRGYLETRVGAAGIARLVDPGSDPTRLFAAAAAGDPQARRIVEEVTVLLGAGIANLATILDPALVVFGGGLSNAGPPLLDSIRQVVLRIVPNVPEIRLSALGDEAQLHGSLFSALQLAERRLSQIAVGQPSAALPSAPPREAGVAVV